MTSYIQQKTTKTISVPLELELYKTITNLAKIDDVPITTIVRRALNKCYNVNQGLIEN